MSELVVEIVEGPGAGRQLPLRGTIELGRDPSLQVVLADAVASRRHARLWALPDGGAAVEDLGSSNGTFVNGSAIGAPARIGVNDQVVIGTTVLLLRSRQQVAERPSAVHQVPAFATAPQPPAPPGLLPPPDPAGPPGGASAAPTPATAGEPGSPLDRYLDARVKARARTAPLAILVLAVLALIVVLAFAR